VKRIPHRIRWWIALIADLIVFVPSSVKSGIWQRLPDIAPWTLVFSVSALFLIALAVVYVWEWLHLSLTDIRSQLSQLRFERLPRPVAADHALRIETETKNRTVAIQAAIQTERGNTNKAIEGVYKTFYDQVGQINSVLNDLRKSKPEPPLKERTTQLANDMFAMLKQQGAKPPHALSDKAGTVAGQTATFNAYFEWQNRVYYNYMAFFRDRVVKIDYELAAAGIMTKLTRPEIDCIQAGVMENHNIDVKHIAETLLLTASRMPS
jgi:hypothetical protein